MQAAIVREYPDTPTMTGSRRARPGPTGTSTAGNHRSHWASSPGRYVLRPDGSGGRYSGRSSRTRVRSTVRPRSQPIRSATTVAGIVGVPFSSARISPSTASSADGIGRRSYLGGAVLRSAVLTVFRLSRSRRLMPLIETCSARCNRRISAHSSTLSNPFLPGGLRRRQPGLDRSVLQPSPPEGVRSRPSIGGQYSAAVDNA
jgi:hypothetical protein